ncbi:bifunctional diguanylate cyclase/phosphodiesterase [Sphingomonas sp. LY54]|uniref:putative bifunctional diguanylate cyclase/phosphodiesterase n=1 Tax=Sphingomonadales TaxID=204457 RepID=UPI002ADEBBA5|nr:MULTISPECIES: bifunctional diguanylate cyclase/phosphodiesterase [Sphingomonadales]MEA1013518.1 bifunctional diguanylate cyclase/phosphodiesterase [Sphingosinicella sp. LY1275]WRP28946.1 bifunctional diguanylate cyclase/phosphodiesterase [Sphingomonas sp. LY54]
MAAGVSAPLFVLSFRHRDELTRLAESAGWQPIAARRTANAEGRFVSSGATVAVVDARGALEEGYEGVRALADPAEANAAALLVLVSRNDGEALDRLHEAGATHFLVSPFSDHQFLKAVQFAARHADRVAGGYRPRRSEEAGQRVSWRWQPGASTVELSPALARKAGIGGENGQRIPLIELFRKLDADGRRAARGAIDRLMATGESTAFAHHDEDGARLAHHLRVGADSEIVGRTETIAVAENGPLQSRDPMTGLRDAHAARAWLGSRLAGAESDQPQLVVLLLAVSRFDTINAAFGRATGDSVLQAVARRIERVVEGAPRRRFVARLAGAEFVIAMAAPTTLAEARFLAGQLVEAIARPFMSGHHVITLGSRVGIAASASGDDAAALLRRASSALVDAKNADTGPIRVLDSEAQSDTALGDQLEIDLRRALDKDEIEILFQPQVSTTTGAITGAEALARWRHPTYGELGAITLFSVAERSDYLVQLSDHVQRKAIAAAAAWPASLAHLRVAVNITAEDIVRPGFAAQFLDLVEKSGFDRSRLTVEVTETGLIEDLNAAATLLAELREGGLRIAIDDFGTGYSSLAYLKALPLDYLKIDKRLCEDITGSPRDRIVVRSVIDMARSLGLAVIAEGVETEEQLGLLAQEGCNLYQGFLCSKPIDSAALEALVAG